MLRSRRLLSPLLLVVGLWLTVASSAAGDTLLIHLPSAPSESANRQAAALTTLVEVLSEKLPGVELEAKIFRRWRDANAFLQENAGSVSLVLGDASFVLALAAGGDLQPVYRFQLGGRGTYRRLLVVRNDRTEIRKLADLRGRSLSVVETAGEGDLGFLARRVFEGELDPEKWFASIEPSTDDFAATASVLYGQTEAALIAEYNPLLVQHLDKELRSVFTSPELPLPMLAVRESAFDDGQRQALAAALASLTKNARGQETLADLGIEGFEALPEGAQALTVSARQEKAFEIALPTGGANPLALPPSLPRDALSFAFAVELPEVPLPVDNLP